LIRLLLLSLFLCAAPASAQDEDFTGGHASLILGRWTGHRIVGVPQCPDDSLCEAVIVVVRITDAETLSGSPVPARLRVRLSVYTPPRRGRASVLAIWPGEQPRTWSGTLATVTQPGTDACVSTELLVQLHLPPPRRSYMRGEETCFTI
jgi:hypothetical protein